jgi:hypothetical protein
MALAACVALAACERDEIHAYRAPKPVHHAPVANAKVVWTTPAGWESVASDQPMRLATFRPGSEMPEVALSAFPGDAGGLLPNINRWRKQIELAEMDEAQLKEAAEFVEKDGVKVALVDFAAGEGQRMLGAVIVPGDGQTWFLKSSGAAVSLGKIKPDFDALAKSFRVELTAAPAAPDGKQVQSRLEAWPSRATGPRTPRHPRWLPRRTTRRIARVAAA